jgi:hypothetical protein
MECLTLEYKDEDRKWGLLTLNARRTIWGSKRIPNVYHPQVIFKIYLFPLYKFRFDIGSKKQDDIPVLQITGTIKMPIRCINFIKAFDHSERASICKDFKF